MNWTSYLVKPEKKLKSQRRMQKQYVLFTQIYTLLILHFTTTIIGQKSHNIEILMNTVHTYNSYGLPICGFPIHEMERIRDYRCMKWIFNSVLSIIYSRSIFCNYQSWLKPQIENFQKISILAITYKKSINIYVLIL